jgi:hypothetical protein
MFALLTLPRGVPVDPEASAVPAYDLPMGIVIRPGPAPVPHRLRDRSAQDRGTIDSIT